VRIARVLTRLNLGGPARQALASDPLLVERGHDLRVFCGRPEPGEGDLFETFRQAGLDVVRVKGLGRAVSPLGDLAALRRLRGELTRFAPDVVHTHASKAGALGRLAASRVLGAAKVHTFHGHVLEGYFGTLTSRALIAGERALARRTDRVLAVSRATGDDLVRLGVVTEDRLAISPPGIDLAPLLALEAGGGHNGPWRRRIGASGSDFLMAVVGRLAEVKCPGRVVDVLQMVGPRCPSLRLVFVGDGAERPALERRLASLPEEERERVHLAGAVAEMPELLAEVDGLLSCSRAEGLPVAMIEAGAAGLPVVASNVGGVAELVEHEETGLLPEDTAGLARAIIRLAEDRELGRAFGRRARARVAERHSAVALADRLEMVYLEAMEGRR